MSGSAELRDGRVVRFKPLAGYNYEDDEYGFSKRFRGETINQLIETFNNELGSPGWVRTKGFFLGALFAEFRIRKIDCSSFIHDGEMDLSRNIRLEGDKITQV